MTVKMFYINVAELPLLSSCEGDVPGLCLLTSVLVGVGWWVELTNVLVGGDAFFRFFFFLFRFFLFLLPVPLLLPATATPPSQPPAGAGARPCPLRARLSALPRVLVLCVIYRGYNYRGWQ